MLALCCCLMSHPLLCRSYTIQPRVAVYYSTRPTVLRIPILTHPHTCLACGSASCPAETASAAHPPPLLLSNPERHSHHDQEQGWQRACRCIRQHAAQQDRHTRQHWQRCGGLLPITLHHRRCPGGPGHAACPLNTCCRLLILFTARTVRHITDTVRPASDTATTTVTDTANTITARTFKSVTANTDRTATDGAVCTVTETDRPVTAKATTAIADMFSTVGDRQEGRLPQPTVTWSVRTVTAKTSCWYRGAPTLPFSTAQACGADVEGAYTSAGKSNGT